MTSLSQWKNAQTRWSNFGAYNLRLTVCNYSIACITIQRLRQSVSHLKADIDNLGHYSFSYTNFLLLSISSFGELAEVTDLTDFFHIKLLVRNWAIRNVLVFFLILLIQAIVATTSKNLSQKNKLINCTFFKYTKENNLT